MIITWKSDQSRFHKTKPLLSYQVRWELSNGTLFIHLRDVEKKLENCPGNSPEPLEKSLKWSFFGPQMICEPWMISKTSRLVAWILSHTREKDLQRFTVICKRYQGLLFEKIIIFERWLINLILFDISDAKHGLNRDLNFFLWWVKASKLTIAKVLRILKVHRPFRARKMAILKIFPEALGHSRGNFPTFFLRHVSV